MKKGILLFFSLIILTGFYAIPKMPGIDNSDPLTVMSILEKVYGIKLDSYYKVDDGYKYMSKSMVNTGKTTFSYTMTLNFDKQLSYGAFTAYSPKDPDNMMPYIAGLFAPEGMEDEVKTFVKQTVNSSKNEISKTFSDAKYTIFNTSYVTLMYIEDIDYEAYCEGNFIFDDTGFSRTQPTKVPTKNPTTVPTPKQTVVPTITPTTVPTKAPTVVPTEKPTAVSNDKSTKVPAGRYVIGEDIPAGTYTIYVKSTNAYLTVWGSAYDNYQSNGGLLLHVSLVPGINSRIEKVILEEGNVIDFTGTVFFKKYEGVEFSITETTKIPAGRYVIGEDIPAGTYSISTKGVNAYLTVWGSTYDDYRTNGGLLLHISLVPGLNSKVAKVTLEEGNVIDFDGALYFDKYTGLVFSLNEKTTVPAGRYIVGDDIPAGTYSISVKNSYAYLIVWGSAYDDYRSNGGLLYHVSLVPGDNAQIGKIILEEGNVIDFDSELIFDTLVNFSFL